MQISDKPLSGFKKWVILQAWPFLSENLLLGGRVFLERSLVPWLFGKRVSATRGSYWGKSCALLKCFRHTELGIKPGALVALVVTSVNKSGLCAPEFLTFSVDSADCLQ